MSPRALRDGELFEIVIQKMVDRWSGSIEAGERGRGGEGMGGFPAPFPISCPPLGVPCHPRCPCRRHRHPP